MLLAMTTSASLLKRQRPDFPNPITLATHIHRCRLVQMFSTYRILITFTLTLLASDVSAQQDPIRNFCRRFGHQTAVVDRKLFIDGGLINYSPLSQFPANYSSKLSVLRALSFVALFIHRQTTGVGLTSDNSGNVLLYEDLDVLASTGMPQIYGNLSKNDSIPSVSGGTLWADDVNKRFYLFGGEYYQQPPPASFTLWSYDVLNNVWESFGSPRETSIRPLSYGAGLSISERGEGYYYGGWMSNSSIADWSGPPAASSSMIKYDMDSNSWTNITGPDNTKRAEGVMVFIPIGDGGMLVYFGGVQEIRDSNGTNEVVGQPMDEIFLYDVLSSKWYTQPATGTVPSMRRRFCAGATWAPDQSSYNMYSAPFAPFLCYIRYSAKSSGGLQSIFNKLTTSNHSYLYGGAGTRPQNSAGFDDVYILTIPSFQWIKLYPDDDQGNKTTGDFPHHTLSCNVISNAQMLVIGGTFPITDNCDVPEQFGTHNLDMGQQNEKKAVWDLYVPNLTTYAVPEPIIDVVGGSASGGATKTKPDKGFSHRDLDALMTRTAEIAERTPTRDVSGENHDEDDSGNTGLSTGAIAGIAVGAAVILIVMVVGCCWYVRQRRRSRKGSAAGPGAGSINTGGGQSWSPVMANVAYSPNSAGPYSPGGSPYMLHRPRAELDTQPPPGTNIWRGSDGVTYELLNAGYSMGGTGMGNVKTDSQGRVWMQVSPGPPPMPSPGGASATSATATAVNSPHSGYSASASPGGGRGHHQRLSELGGTEGKRFVPPAEPQELATETETRPSFAGSNGYLGVSNGNGNSSGGMTPDTPSARSRHDTYYHP